MALAFAAPEVKNPALAEGIRLYDALDYAGALQSLTQALDRSSTRADTARVHLYIGLIQHRYKLKLDAEASFLRALEHDPRVRLPKGTPQSAKQLFRKIKKDKLGIDDEPADPPPKRKKVQKQRESDPDPPDSMVEEDDPQVSRTTTVSHETARIAEDDPPVEPKLRADPNRRLTPSTQAEVESKGAPIGGWIGIGVGVAAAATGITFAILAGQNGSEALQEPVASRAQELHALAVEQRTLSIVSFGASAAAITIAAVLFLTDD